MLNWSLYIVAMVTNNVVEASLGYYINPLVSIVPEPWCSASV